MTLVAAAMLAACTSTATAPPPPTASASATTHRVDPALGGWVDAFFANDAAEVFRNRQALLVTVDGRTVVERYWRSSATTSGDIESVGKTILSTLIGIALDEGKLRSLDQTVGQLLPAYSRVMSREVAAITLRQLLTMTSGLTTDDEFYPKVFGTRQDWVREILRQGLTAPPGSFQYSSAGSHLLSAILSQATGSSLLEYARAKLFDPLGIDTRPATAVSALPGNLDDYQRARFTWPTDPQGRYIGGGGQKLTARDMARFGQLWLQDGRWATRQLVSSAWLAAARHASTTTGYSEPAPDAYGYQVWLGKSGGHDAYFAMGFAGQLIEVVPDLGLVVAVLSRHNPDPRVPAEPGTADSVQYVEFVANIVVPTIH